MALLQRFVSPHIGFARGVLRVGGTLRDVALLLCVDGGDIGGWVGVGIGLASLFAVAYEVFEVLDRRHGDWSARFGSTGGDTPNGLRR